MAAAMASDVCAGWLRSPDLDRDVEADGRQGQLQQAADQDVHHRPRAWPERLGRRSGRRLCRTSLVNWLSRQPAHSSRYQSGGAHSCLASSTCSTTAAMSRSV